uniref:Uncharacterized protein n=1 Tax=Rhizophora mucronata TaxID=61149 RepID=A0A2P2PLB9_RHIMU
MLWTRSLVSISVTFCSLLFEYASKKSLFSFSNSFHTVEVMTGLMLACLARASMHSSLLILNMMHSSIRWCTM